VEAYWAASLYLEGPMPDDGEFENLKARANFPWLPEAPSSCYDLGQVVGHFQVSISNMGKMR
jgi:hypothetical protein